MKKALLVLLLAALVLPVFADDALVMPKGVLRVWVAPNYGFASEEWDADGDAADVTPDGISFFNLALALEYGVNDWVTAAVQWAPGWNIWSDMGISGMDAKLGTFFDLFIGAKFQIVGPKAPVQRDDMRFAAAVGFKAPMPAADANDEFADFAAGDEFILSEADKHAWGVGTRLYYDYIINKNFFINAYLEYIYYFEKKDEEAITFAPPVSKYDIEYGYDFTFEIEPQYQMPMANGMILKAGLPFTYESTPESKINGTGMDDASYMLAVSPSVGVFFTKAVVPFELELKYKLPLMGENTVIMHNIALQGKFYLKF